MARLVLVASGVLEAVWAVALGRSVGFSRLLPSAVFVVALVASMGGLAFALRTLPVGTAYAAWVGVGAGLAVAWGMATGTEDVSLAPLGQDPSRPSIVAISASWVSMIVAASSTAGA